MTVIQSVRIGRCLILNGSSREQCLQTLVAASCAHIEDPPAFLKGLQQRESIMSTGLGHGLAYPHLKTVLCPEFFVTVGLHQLGVDWEALDEKPVHIVFLIGGPAGRQEDYLKLLAALASFAHKGRLLQRLPELSAFPQLLSQLYDQYAS